jgi:hypothetical protein
MHNRSVFVWPNAKKKKTKKRNQRFKGMQFEKQFGWAVWLSLGVGPASPDKQVLLALHLYLARHETLCTV